MSIAAAFFYFLLSLPTLASASISLDSTEAITYSTEEYAFPDLPSDMSTICSPGLYVPKAESKELNVRVLSDLPEASQMRHRRKLELRYYPAPQPTNKVLLIVGGIGSDSSSIFSKFYGQKAQAAGYHALAFPNTLTSDFIYSSSSHGLIGDTKTDAADLHRAIIAAVNKLKEMGVRAPEIKLLGYSHGALLAAAVDKLNSDLQEQGLQTTQFQFVLMVNPPVDLLYGLRNVDDRAAAAKKIPFVHLMDLGLRFQKFVSMQQKTPTTSETFHTFAKQLRYASREAYAIIGYVMQRSLGPAIYASQRVNDLGILPTVTLPKNDPFRRYEERAIRDQANSYSFESYFNVFFGTRFQRDHVSIDLVDMNQRASLTAYESHLRKSKNIYLLHNSDDLLLRPEDTRWLANVFRGRARFFPRGGHMGNIWFSRNIEFFEDWLAK